MTSYTRLVMAAAPSRCSTTHASWSKQVSSWPRSSPAEPVAARHTACHNTPCSWFQHPACSVRGGGITVGRFQHVATAVEALQPISCSTWRVRSQHHYCLFSVTPSARCKNPIAAPDGCSFCRRGCNFAAGLFQHVVTMVTASPCCHLWGWCCHLWCWCCRLQDEWPSSPAPPGAGCSCVERRLKLAAVPDAAMWDTDCRSSPCRMQLVRRRFVASRRAARPLQHRPRPPNVSSVARRGSVSCCSGRYQGGGIEADLKD